MNSNPAKSSQQFLFCRGSKASIKIAFNWRLLRDEATAVNSSEQSEAAPTPFQFKT
jgi:hypothetical protein